MSVSDSLTPAPPMKDAATVILDVAPRALGDGLEYRDLLRSVDRRGYAPFILFAAILLLLPIDFVLPQVAALTLAVCGIGLLTGAQAPWLPGFLGKRKINQKAIEELGFFFKAQQSWMHLLVEPRHPELARGAGEKLVAWALILLGLGVAPPQMPDVIPALGAIALAAGLFQRDGLVMMLGAAVALGWTAFLAAMTYGLATQAPFALGWGHDHAPWLMQRFSPPAQAAPR